MKIFACTLLLIGSIGLCYSQETKYFIKTEPSKKVSATATYKINYPNLEATEWVIYAPVAPNIPSQSITKSSMSPTGKQVDEFSANPRKFFVSRFPVRDKAAKTEMTIQLTYEGTLFSRQLTPVTGEMNLPKVKELTAAERKAYLRENELNNFTDPDFKKWLTAKKLEKDKSESDLDFARRVFLTIKSTFKYEYTSKMDRKATSVCQAGQSDCGGMGVLFVSVCRSQGIPARVLYGRWAISSQGGEKLGEVEYHQWHAKAEFYAQGIGWVPVDVSSGVLHDKSKEGLKFFGNDRGDFITFHVDDELLLDTFHFGKAKVPLTQGPLWWVTGQGNLNNATVKESWTVKELK
jgi:transglutaminase-like putative cysteine protease